MPYGFCVAGFFLQRLHFPTTTATEELQQYEDDAVKDEYERGGETVNRDLRALVKDIHI